MNKIKDAMTDNFGNLTRSIEMITNKQADTQYTQHTQEEDPNEGREQSPSAMDYAVVAGKKIWQHRADIGLAVIGLALFDLADTVELTRDISAATLLELRPDLKA